MSRLLDWALQVAGLGFILLVAAFPRLPWPATPTPSPTPMLIDSTAGFGIGGHLTDAEAIKEARRYCGPRAYRVLVDPEETQIWCGKTSDKSALQHGQPPPLEICMFGTDAAIALHKLFEEARAGEEIPDVSMRIVEAPMIPGRATEATVCLRPGKP